MENQMKRLVAMVVPDLLVLRGQFVVFVDVQRVPRIVDPPVFNGDAAEIRDAFGNLANFGFDFFMQYCHADSAEIFFQQFVQAEFHGNRLSSTSSTTSTFLPFSTSGTGSSHWTFFTSSVT